jgi:predicted amidohydrolase
MRLALLQARGTPGDVAANLAALREAASAGADLVVTPEAFLTGYDIGAEALRELAGPLPQEVGAIAREHGVAIACGWVERDGDRVYNSATLFDATGAAILTHRKAHLYDFDRDAFAPGDAFAVAEVGGLRVGLLICFDVEFPEAARALALAGAQLIVVPTSLMAPYDVVARTLVPARAAENQVFVAYCNRVGRERELDYVGLSCVIGPDGGELARAGAGPELVVADVDPAAVTAARSAFSYIEQRRPAIY